MAQQKSLRKERYLTALMKRKAREGVLIIAGQRTMSAAFPYRLRSTRSEQTQLICPDTYHLNVTKVLVLATRSMTKGHQIQSQAHIRNPLRLRRLQAANSIQKINVYLTNIVSRLTLAVTNSSQKISPYLAKMVAGLIFLINSLATKKEEETLNLDQVQREGNSQTAPTPVTLWKIPPRDLWTDDASTKMADTM
jgi:hypothetical protein